MTFAVHGLLAGLVLLLAALKMGGHIEWSWWCVVLPLWAPITAAGAVAYVTAGSVVAGTLGLVGEGAAGQVWGEAGKDERMGGSRAAGSKDPRKGRDVRVRGEQGGPRANGEKAR